MRKILKYNSGTLFEKSILRADADDCNDLMFLSTYKNNFIPCRKAA